MRVMQLLDMQISSQKNKPHGEYLIFDFAAIIWICLLKFIVEKCSHDEFFKRRINMNPSRFIAVILMSSFQMEYGR